MLEFYVQQIGDHWEVVCIGQLSGGVVSRDGNYKTKEEAMAARERARGKQ